MENASKALLIAGGVLLSMMILSLLVYVGTTMTDIAESEDRRIATQQLEEFNRSYLVYNKKRMYGTELITLVNKAINHNKTIEATEISPYYVNIIIENIEDFKTGGKVINYNYSIHSNSYETPLDDENKIKQLMGIDEITIALNAGEHNLGSWSSDGTLQMNKGIIGFFEQYKEDKIIPDEEANKTYYIYSALTNFKTAIFACEDVNGDGKSVEYNEEGRIKSMEFKQISID